MEKISIIFVVIYLASFIFSIISANLENSYTQIIGFGVDSFDRVYVGNEHNIIVYNNEKVENIIYPMTNRGYDFTIQNDNIIISAEIFTFIGLFIYVPAFLIRNYKSKFLSNTIFKKR